MLTWNNLLSFIAATSFTFFPSYVLAQEKPLDEKIIAIDAGHQDGDNCVDFDDDGKYDICEGTIVGKIAYKVKEKLEYNGAVVVLTRNDQRGLNKNIEERVEIAKDNEVDLYVSIHTDSDNLYGTKILVGCPAGGRYTTGYGDPLHRKAIAAKAPECIAQGDHYLQALTAAESIMARFAQHGFQEENFRGFGSIIGYNLLTFNLLNQAEIPAMFIEAGHHGNPVEAKKLLTETYQADIADAISGGIIGYFSQNQAL